MTTPPPPPDCRDCDAPGRATAPGAPEGGASSLGHGLTEESAPPPAGTRGPAADAAASGSLLLSRTTVIVVGYGSAHLLRRHLTRVSRMAPEAGVVVVDNYSTPEAREELVHLAGANSWSTVLPTSNLGFGAGVNLGAARAREMGAEILVLLNPDAVIDRSSLIRLAARARGNPRALVAPVLTDSSGRTVSDGTVVCLADGSMRSRRSRRPVPPGGTHPWLSGACLALSATLFDDVGGFDARFFLYWEDVDFSTRVLAAGGSLVLARDAVAVHDEGGTHAQPGQGEHAKSDTYYYYNIRNRLLYAGLHLDRSGQRRWVVTALAAAREVVLRGGRRQLLGSRQPVRTAAAATRDGLRLMSQARRHQLPEPTEPITRDPRPSR